MADSAGIIPSKNSEKSKLSNSINRTTSETLRLNETERVLTQPNSLTSSTPRKKTSFIITSITSRTSNDAGEDSADDLDESHTEDISEIVDNSRITDIENETPSYSEDTFSKDDVFFNASSSLVSAPVIPTSSQYGLALVPTSENSENILNPSDSSEHSENPDLRVEVNESVINLGVVSTKHDPEMRDMHPPAPRTERFKVVKIESTEPFKRGRWICMDYLDHPNIAQNASTNNTKSDSECSLHHPPSEASDTLSITNSAASVVGVPNLGDDQKQQQLTNINNIINSEVSNQLNMQPSDNGQLVNNQTMPITTPSNIPSNYSSVSPGQSLQNNLQMSQPLVNSASPVQPPPPQQQQQQPPPQQSQSQSLSQAHIQQILANSNTHTSLQPQQIQQVLAGTAIPQQAQQPVPAQQPPPQQQQPPPQQPQQPQMQSQQSMPQQPQQQQMMQPQGIPQQIPTMTQYQPQPQAQQNMAQQQQYQPMQQQPQPQMMQQQMQPQQNMQPQMPTVQQVHMQPSVQQNMQQMPMQQQQQQGQQPQIMPQQMQQLTQQMPQQVSYSQQIPQTQQSGVTQTSSQGMMPTMHPQMQNYQQNQMLPNMQPQPIMNIQSQPHLQPQYYTNTMPQSGPMMNSQGGMMPPMSQAGNVGQVNMQTTSTLQPLQSYPVSQPLQQVPGMPQTPPVQTSMPNYTLQMSMSQPTPMQPMSQPLPSLAMQQQPMNYSVPASQGYPQVSSVPSSSIDVRSVIAADRSQESIPAPTAALLESLAEVTAAGDEQPVGEDQDSASGASAVAIDNKIEQAMDLVKSHLMFAVREEVEVLKEKIAELMERITQLESENSLLRASANPDTLAQISSTQSSQASNPP